MLEAMSRCFPFFSAENDSTCLAEMITVFGDRAIKNVAKMLGQYLIKKFNVFLRFLIRKLRFITFIFNYFRSQCYM